MKFKYVKDSRIIIEVLNPELDGISGNSVRFRSIPEFRPHPHLSSCACRSVSWTRERFRNGIPELHRHGIRRNSREFRGISFDSVRFRNSALTLTCCTMPADLCPGHASDSGTEFRNCIDTELDGIPGNSMEFRSIPCDSGIAQLRNR